MVLISTVSNDYVEIEDDDSAFNSDVISIGAWVNLDDNDTGIRTIFQSMYLIQVQ